MLVQHWQNIIVNFTIRPFTSHKKMRTGTQAHISFTQRNELFSMINDLINHLVPFLCKTEVYILTFNYKSPGSLPL